MRVHDLIPVALVALVTLSLAGGADAAGDPERGERVYGVCRGCHALEPGRHLTGPSLADFWGREAGTIEGFGRYSPALAAAELVWNEKTLDAWLEDPQALVPDNRMAFQGIDDADARADLVAFLESVQDGDGERGDGRDNGMMGGMMGAPELQDLEALGPEQQVASIRYCGDAYHVTTAADRTLIYWEFNLRFKTDSSDKGPGQGRPVIIGAGMRGDRAFVVFADPAEISATIEQRC